MIKYFILSDIHAQYDMLIEALDKAAFDINNIEHIIIVAGDILDRGKFGDKTIRYIETLIEKNRVIGVLGNHDIFLINILDDVYKLKKVIWNIKKNGFIETLQLGFKEDIRDKKITKSFINRFKVEFVNKYPVFVEWIKKNPLYIEYNNHVIVHGFINFDLEDWRNTDEHYAVWHRGFDKEVPKSFNKYLIFGHTPNHYIDNQNEIIYDGKKIMIDGGAASRIQLNVLCLTEKEI
jgi:predicted phosphodiesterase